MPDYKKIGLYQSDDYAHKKNMLNPLAGYDNVDLIFTGAFVNSLFVINKTNRVFTFDSSNDKKELLSNSYGKDIFGLNQDWFNNRQKEVYLQELIETIKNNYKIA